MRTIYKGNQSKHGEESEEGNPGCSRCHAIIFTPDDHDPEDLCMPCAYDRILELEAEREVLRLEIAKGDEAIAVLAAEVERLRPVVEAAKEERLAEIAYNAHYDSVYNEDGPESLLFDRTWDSTIGQLDVAVDALLAIESEEKAQ